MIERRPRDQRGYFELDWLKSYHSFSFGDYYDPNHVQFSALRVINDDWIAPQGGFATHGHRNMEILTYVLQGELSHRDSEGNEARIKAGEFQLMSAGRGIFHSEYNHHEDAPVKLLQIWLHPNVEQTPPSYQQRAFPCQTGLQWIVTPSGEGETLTIKQDAQIARIELNPGEPFEWPLHPERHYYLHVVKGDGQINGHAVRFGDGIKLSHESNLTLIANQAFQVLLFDLPAIPR
ncbi:Quercetin 2,3-dioxygenase [Vibrio stylophorae]|uniref:Quercetin 2,3-dioxygenase n=1 Tax=Vibrio stylophorae TaxID=659351 RepID=A0ABM8ZSC6_9VIBR|nr:pirin family protein [Vibrio stylophorae]CAH0533207.1 Quercetin 2,3-dioxygenase [Vibrio stylophorae]